ALTEPRREMHVVHADHRQRRPSRLDVAVQVTPQHATDVLTVLPAAHRKAREDGDMAAGERVAGLAHHRLHAQPARALAQKPHIADLLERSEERRVGKEWRDWWGRDGYRESEGFW